MYWVCTLEKNICISSLKAMYKDIHRHFLYSNPKLEITQTSINRTDKWNIIYSQNEATDTWRSISQTLYHVKCAKQTNKKRYILHNSINMTFKNRQNSSMRREGRIGVISGAGINLEDAMRMMEMLWILKLKSLNL